MLSIENFNSDAVMRSRYKQSTRGTYLLSSCEGLQLGLMGYLADPLQALGTCLIVNVEQQCMIDQEGQEYGEIECLWQLVDDYSS